MSDFFFALTSTDQCKGPHLHYITHASQQTHVNVQQCKTRKNCPDFVFLILCLRLLSHPPWSLWYKQSCRNRLQAWHTVPPHRFCGKRWMALRSSVTNVSARDGLVYLESWGKIRASILVPSRKTWKHIPHDTTGNKKEDGCMSLLVSRSVLGTGRALSVWRSGENGIFMRFTWTWSSRIYQNCISSYVDLQRSLVDLDLLPFMLVHNCETFSLPHYASLWCQSLCRRSRAEILSMTRYITRACLDAMRYANGLDWR